MVGLFGLALLAILCAVLVVVHVVALHFDLFGVSEPTLTWSLVLLAFCLLVSAACVFLIQWIARRSDHLPS